MERTTYLFREEVNLSELAKRIVNTADLYDVIDVFGSIDEADRAITSDLVNNPLAIIISLVEMVEELQSEV